MRDLINSHCKISETQDELRLNAPVFKWEKRSRCLCLYRTWLGSLTSRVAGRGNILKWSLVTKRCQSQEEKVALGRSENDQRTTKVNRLVVVQAPAMYWKGNPKASGAVNYRG